MANASNRVRTADMQFHKFIDSDMRATFAQFRSDTEVHFQDLDSSVDRIDATIAQLRSDTEVEFQNVRATVAQLRSDTEVEFQNVRATIAQLRSDTKVEFQNVRATVAQLRSDTEVQFQHDSLSLELLSTAESELSSEYTSTSEKQASTNATFGSMFMSQNASIGSLATQEGQDIAGLSRYNTIYSMSQSEIDSTQDSTANSLANYIDEVNDLLESKVLYGIYSYSGTSYSGRLIISVIGGIAIFRIALIISNAATVTNLSLMYSDLTLLEGDDLAAQYKGIHTNTNYYGRTMLTRVDSNTLKHSMEGLFLLNSGGSPELLCSVTGLTQAGSTGGSSFYGTIVTQSL